MAKILIVDDEDMYCEYLTVILERRGHEIHAASNGPKAIKIGTAFQPHILVPD